MTIAGWLVSSGVLKRPGNVETTTDARRIISHKTKNIRILKDLLGNIDADDCSNLLIWMVGDT